MSMAPRGPHVAEGPNLFLIGAPKCGTTTLDAVLRQHPQVFMSGRKEPRFFSRDSEYAKGFSTYVETCFGGSAAYPIRGESTPTYLYWHAKTIPRIRNHLPDRGLRFIAILRNPIDRAYSHYWMNRTRRIQLPERLTFEQALAVEDQRIREHPEWTRDGILSFCYFRTGLYADQIEAFYDAFGAANCLVLLFEDLFPENFPASVQAVEAFLAVQERPLEYERKKEAQYFRSRLLAAVMRRYRAAWTTVGRRLPPRLRSGLKSGLLGLNMAPFSYPAMTPSTRKVLAERYRPHIEHLERLIGRDLSQWRDWNEGKRGAINNGFPAEVRAHGGTDG